MVSQIRSNPPGSIIMGNAGLPWPSTSLFYPIVNGALTKMPLGMNSRGLPVTLCHCLFCLVPIAGRSMHYLSLSASRSSF